MAASDEVIDAARTDASARAGLHTQRLGARAELVAGYADMRQMGARRMQIIALLAELARATG